MSDDLERRLAVAERDRDANYAEAQGAYSERNQAQERADTLEAENARLREALRPFADYAREHVADDAKWRETSDVSIVVNIGDLRGAAGALEIGEEPAERPARKRGVR